MLNRQNLTLNRWAFKWMSKLHFVPFDYNTTQGKLIFPKPDDPKSKWSFRSFRFWQLLQFLYMTYILTKTVLAIAGDTSNWKQIPLLIIASMTSIVVPYNINAIYDRQPAIHVKLTNEFWPTAKDEETKEQDEQFEGKESTEITGTVNQEIRAMENQPFDIRLKIIQILEKKFGFQLGFGKYRPTFTELLICIFPLLFYPIVLIYPMTYAADPNHPLLLISSVPDDMKHPLVIIACQIIEMFNVTTYIANVHVTTYSTLSFISTFKATARMELEKVRNKTLPMAVKLADGQKTLKLLRLKMSLFNMCYATNAFIGKLIATTCAILGGYSVIKLIHTELTYAFVYLFFFTNAIIAYLGMFDSAHQPTSLVEKLKRELSIWTKGQTLTVKECRRTIRAIPSVGLRFGGFRGLERESTLLFINFVIEQIVGLLISF